MPHFCFDVLKASNTSKFLIWIFSFSKINFLNGEYWWNKGWNYFFWFLSLLSSGFVFFSLSFLYWQSFRAAHYAQTCTHCPKPFTNWINMTFIRLLGKRRSRFVPFIFSGGFLLPEEMLHLLKGYQIQLLLVLSIFVYCWRLLEVDTSCTSIEGFHSFLLWFHKWIHYHLSFTRKKDLKKKYKHILPFGFWLSSLKLLKYVWTALLLVDQILSSILHFEIFTSLFHHSLEDWVGLKPRHHPGFWA